MDRTGAIEFRSGRWWARPTLADGSRGRRVQLPKGASEVQAREKAAALTELAQRTATTRSSAVRSSASEPPRGPSVAEWGEAWLDDRKRRRLRSVRTDRGRWSKWVEPQLGQSDMATIPTEELERFVEFLDQQVRDGVIKRAKTARNIWGLVSKAFDDAAHSKTLALRVRKDNPAEKVRPPDEGTELGKQFLYPSEFLALMTCERAPMRWRRIFALNVYLYCRAGELEALHVEDVDLEHRIMHIHRSVDRDDDTLKETKTNNPRRIPIEPHLLPLLEQLVAEARAEGRERLVEMPPLCDLAPRLRKYLGWAGVARAELFRTTSTSKQITFHDLRSTAATWLAIRREAPQFIMALCGHENMETTLGYVRLAGVLSEVPASVFPALPADLSLPQSLPQDPKATGSAGGKLAQLLRKRQRPQRDSNPLECHGSASIQPESVGSDAPASRERQRVSARNVVFGAELGQSAPLPSQNPLGGLQEAADPEAAAALALVGRHVLAESQLWDRLEADVLWLADPAAGGAR